MITPFLLAIAAGIDLLLGIYVLLKNHQGVTNISYIAIALTMAFWAAASAFFQWTHDKETLARLATMLYVTPLLIIPPFIYFSYSFLQERLSIPRLAAIILWLGTIATLVLVYAGFVVEGASFGPPRAVFFGPAIIAFEVWISGTLFWGALVLLRTWKRSINDAKVQASYVFIGAILEITLGLLAGIVAPRLGYFMFHPLAPFGSIIVTTTYLYAIVRYRLLNIKVVSAELLTLAVWVFLFIQALLAVPAQQKVTSWMLFVLVVIFGVLLIRAVNKEVEQRERLEAVTRELEAANEELQKLDQAKSEFISIASHQLRTPLTVIRGYASMAEEGALGKIDKKVGEALKKISLSARQLVILVDDLLDLSRIEAGKIKYDFARCNFSSTVRAVIAEIEPNARQKDITIEFENGAKELPPFIFDEEKIRQVVMNIIDNAIKYSPMGSVIQVVVEKSGDTARLRVKDQGIGVSPEDKRRLFTKFARSHEAQHIYPNGLGIGLYFVKRVVEDHGGRVRVESEGAGKGSTFTVELPLKYHLH